MATSLIIAGIGLAVSAASTAVSIQQNRRATQVANRAAISTQQENDRIRRLQDQRRRLAATRERRRAIRQQLIASATGRARAVAQGVDLRSSPVEGAQAQSTQEGAFNVTNVNQEEEIGAGISSATQTISDIGTRSNVRVARFQSNAAAGQGAASFGRQLVGNAQTISKISQSLFG